MSNLPAIQEKPFDKLKNKIAAFAFMNQYGIVWKEFRKEGKIHYLDNDGKYIAGVDPYK